MSFYAGIDVSTKAIDVVLLDEDTGRALHERRLLTVTRGTAVNRIRYLRDRMPVRSEWRDLGVLAIAIEAPFSRALPGSVIPLSMTIGALLQVLPPELPLELMRADDWRRACGLPIRGKGGNPVERRAHLKGAAIAFAAEHWIDYPRLDDNVADAFGLSWACRLQRQAAAAA